MFTYSLFRSKVFPNNVRLVNLETTKVWEIIKRDGDIAEGENVSIYEHPFFPYLLGNKTPYETYLDKFKLSEVEANCRYFGRFARFSYEYLAEPHPDEYMVAHKESEDLVLEDGLHRASFLYKNNVRIVPVIIKDLPVKPTTLWDIILALQVFGKTENGTPVIYHSLPFEEIPQKFGCDVAKRLEALEPKYDFNRRRGLDLGCYIGGWGFTLYKKYHTVTLGIDHTKTAIDAASLCASYYNVPVRFLCEDINRALDAMIIENKYFDFCLWLNTFHWIVAKQGKARAMNILKKISKLCPVLFFETAILDGETSKEMADQGFKSEEDLLTFIKAVVPYAGIDEISVDPVSQRKMYKIRFS